MQPTLEDDELLFVEKVSKHFGDPARYDVVICHYDDSNTNYVKRIIGLPGETISIVDGKPYINGEPLQDDVYGSGLKPHDMDPVTIPEDCVFVMGDNRANSMDSVSIGPIQKKYIVGLSLIHILRSMDDRALREIALIENLQRVNLNPVEEAESISLLMQEYGLTQENVSERVGKSRSAVANALRLLSLPPAVLQMVRDGKLSSGHARAVLSVPGEDRQLAFAEEIVKQGYSVREAEKRAKLWKEEAARPAKKKAVLDLHLRSAQEELQQRLGTKVEFTGTPEKGKISICILYTSLLCYKLISRKKDSVKRYMASVPA